MIGEAFSLGAALCWSVGVILFRRSLSVSPLAANLFKNAVAMGLMLATLLVTLPATGGLHMDRSTEDWLRLILSGFLGISLSDLLFFHALRYMGPGRLAVVECAYAPSVVAFSVPFLGERPTLGFAVGAVLVVMGMVVVTRPGPAARLPQNADPAAKALLLRGTLLGVGAMLTSGLAIVVAKPAFGSGSLAEISLIRLLAGTAGQVLYMLPSRERRGALAELRGSQVWRTLLPATILGSWLSTIMWIGGFKYTDASVAAVLNQTATVWTLLLSRVLLGEPLTRRGVLGVALGFTGALAVLLTRVS